MAQDLYSNIDALPAENIAMLADRLEARAELVGFAAMRDRYFDLMALAPDAQVLELGGGTGIVGRALLQYGAVKAAEDGLSHLMDFQVVDALSGEGLGERTYDAVILHTLLSHVPDPESAIAVAQAAGRPGATIAIFDADYASLQIVSGDLALDDQVNDAIKTHAVAQPTIMRHVPRLASARGLHRMTSQAEFISEIGGSEFFIGLAQAVSRAVVAQGGLSASVAEAWVAALNAAVAQDAFFGMCPYFTYLYRVP